MVSYRQKLKKAWMEQMQLKQIKENYEKIFDWKEGDKKRESVEHSLRQLWDLCNEGRKGPKL